MSDSPETLVRNFFAAFPASDVEELVSFFSDDEVYIDGPRGVGLTPFGGHGVRRLAPPE